MSGSSIEGRPLRSLNILVVDTDSEIWALMCDYFREQGHRVAETDNWQDALKQMHVDNFDTVLMELQLPAMDCVEAARRLRAEGRLAATALFAFKGSAAPEGFNANLFTEVLRKPMTPKAVLAHIWR